MPGCLLPVERNDELDQTCFAPEVSYHMRRPGTNEASADTLPQETGFRANHGFASHSASMFHRPNSRRPTELHWTYEDCEANLRAQSAQISSCEGGTDLCEPVRADLLGGLQEEKY